MVPPPGQAGVDRGSTIAGASALARVFVWERLGAREMEGLGPRLPVPRSNGGRRPRPASAGPRAGVPATAYESAGGAGADRPRRIVPARRHAVRRRDLVGTRARPDPVLARCHARLGSHACHCGELARRVDGNPEGPRRGPAGMARDGAGRGPVGIPRLDREERLAAAREGYVGLDFARSCRVRGARGDRRVSAGQAGRHAQHGFL